MPIDIMSLPMPKRKMEQAQEQEGPEMEMELGSETPEEEANEPSALSDVSDEDLLAEVKKRKLI